MTSYTIGVDLGGTNTRVAAYTKESGLLDPIHMPTRLPDGKSAVIGDICQAIRHLRDLHSSEMRLVGICVGSPGPLELPAGRLRNLPNFPGWAGFELRATLEQALGASIVVEHDANLAALAECLLGKGKTFGIDSLCMLTLGTGVGSGIICQGKIWDGMNGMAGEAGHNTIWPDGQACPCGSHGCLEQYASASAVRRMVDEVILKREAPGLAALEKRNPEFSAADVHVLALAGDPDAKRIFDSVGRALGIGLASLVNTLNFSLYVVGGGLANAWELFSPCLFAELHHRSYVYRFTLGQLDGHEHSSPVTHVEPAALGPEAGILGACLLPFAALANDSVTRKD
jgi:glucokinase